jgi:predicted pyridoxine 5'-phosphate oxidase superfamily flavin-nucleotide-binding protein
MKTLVRFTDATLLALPLLPHAASAQPAQPPAPDGTAPPPPDAAQPPPPAPDATPPTPPPVVTPAPAPTPPPPAGAAPAVPKGPEWTSLRLLHDKGVISDAELESALKDIGIVGAGDATTMVLAKIKTTLYGYAEANYVYDSTQSCVEFCGGSQIQREGTYRGNHGRTLFGARDSRIGIRLAAPEEHGIRASGLIETDFFGPTATTEQGTYANAVLRVRQAYAKLETPVVDLLLGQTWSLFGWQPTFLLTSVQLPGLPGQMFERTTQFKVSKTIKGEAVTAEIAAAANRPPQQDSATPEGVFGARLNFNKWTGQHTAYMNSTTIIPASIAVSGDLRKFRIPEFAVTPHTGHVRVGGGVAFDAYLPIVPATKTNKDNALSLTGELAIGSGTSDMYTALGAAGTANASLPPAAPGGTPIPYPTNFDPGLATVDASGHIELVQWTTYAAGLEFYPAGTGGHLGTFASYQHSESPNAKNIGTAAVIPQTTAAAQTAAQAKIRDHEDFFEVGLFVEPTKSTRVAASGSVFDDTYGDGKDAKNYALQMSAWIFF